MGKNYLQFRIYLNIFASHLGIETETMNYQVKDCSPKAKLKIENFNSKYPKVKREVRERKVNSEYPWNELEIGKCFTSPANDMLETILRNQACRFSAETNKRFIVIAHRDLQVFECARIY